MNEDERKAYRQLIDQLTEELDYWTKPLECKVVHEQPYDFKQCETHDRTFPLDGDCDYRGLSIVEYDEKMHHEQRGRAVRAEMRADQADNRVNLLATELEKSEAKLAKVRDLHYPVEIEPSDTICGECSMRLPNGRYFGKVEEWPCPTRKILDGDSNDK